MDDARFDEMSRRVASRRTVVGGLTVALAALTSPLVPDALGKKRKRRTGVRDEGKKKKKKKKCKGGTLKCGKTCVNASTDALNCGGCGRRCGSGQACVDGACQSTGPVACPTGQERCGGQCVDLQSDEAHCGTCGNRCEGDLTCLGGTCGCADTGDTRCGNSCVDTLADDDHCGSCDVACQGDLTCLHGTCDCAGSGLTRCGTRCVNTQNDNANCSTCGNACPSGQTCRLGACSADPCDVNQRQCLDGTCIPDTPEYCCVDYDCGQFSGDLHCRNNVCVCREEDEGICRRYAGGGGLCDVCCPGGTGSCPGDQICVVGATPDQKFCSCPPGKQRCAGNQNSFLCQDSVGNDQDRCGTDCVNCDTAFPGSVCCNGRCSKGCAPGATCPPSTPCTGCQPCPEGTMCCNQGSGNLFGCVVPDNLGRCPIPEN